MADTTPMDDGQEREARIERMLAETRKFVEEGLKLQAEVRKLGQEELKLQAESLKLTRDASLAPWQATFAGFGAGAALVGALVAATKLIG